MLKMYYSGDAKSLDMESGIHHEENRNCCDGGVDRISSLPDKAISKILMCLPIKEAVGTSKLSTTWRYKWMSIPELVFDQHASYGGAQGYPDQRVSFINNVLLLHDGDITKFEIIDLMNYTSSHVDRWLLLLSRKKLTDLLIHFKLSVSGVDLYACHSCLFSCQALSTLKLKFCRLELPLRTRFNGFKNLIVLDLEEVNASKETIEFLVNTSPLLENLCITQWNSNVISDVNISAPNLRKCGIHGNFKGINTFVKTPKLRNIDISLGMSSDLRGIVGGLDKIQKASFSHPVIEALSKNVTYHYLNHLKLNINFKDPEQVWAALWLSKNSPTLKTIDIKIGRLRKRTVHNAIPKLQEMYDLLGESRDVLQSLETFELEGFGGSENELRFIQFFLLHASVLQTMNIWWKFDDTNCLLQQMNIPFMVVYASHRKREGVLLELVQFQRASPGVKIKLYDLKK